MLNEQSKIKLDGIIKQMIANKESEKTIQMVVDDFKSKYDTAKFTTSANASEKSSWFKENVIGGYKDRISDVKGAAKGVVNTLTGISSLGERGIKSLGRIVTPKKYEERLGFSKFEEGEKTSAEKLIPEKFRTPEKDEKLGFALEQIAEFLIPIPGTKVSKVIKLTKTGKVIQMAKTAGKTTAEFSAKTAAQRGEVKPGDIAVSAGAVIAGGLVTKLGAEIFKIVPTWLMQKAIGQKPLAFIEGQDVSKYALKNRKVGTVNSLMNRGNVEIDKAIKEINDKLPKNQAIQPSWVKSYVDGAIKNLKEKNIEATLASMNSALKYDVGKVFPKLGLEKPMIKAYNETILRDALKVKMAEGAGQKRLSMDSIIPLLMGGYGYSLGGIPGAVGGYITKKVLTSIPVLTSTAVTMDVTKRLAEKGLNKLTIQERESILRVMMGLLSQGVQK